MQVSGTTCEAFTMPPFLLLFSKALLARRLPAVFALDPASHRLTLRRGVVEPPWLLGEVVSGEFVVSETTPWWYCLPCWNYFVPRTNGSFPSEKRVPMRNWMEGHFTKWHVDLAYPHLHAKLRVLYPEHPTLPSPDDVLQWRRARDELNAEWRAFHALPKRQQCDGARVALGKRRDDLASLELRRAPPAHLSIFRSPIPTTYFKRAEARDARRIMSCGHLFL